MSSGSWIFALVSSEHVLFGGADEVGGASVAGEVEAADDGSGDCVCLAHHKIGCGCDLVDDGDLGHVHRAIVRVGASAQIEDGREARDADRNVDEASSPRPTERVGDHDGDRRPGRSFELHPEAMSGPIGVDRQEDGVPVGNIGPIDAGIGTDESVFGLGDDEISAAAQDRSCLTFGQLPVRVVVRSGSIRPSALETTLWVTTTTSRSMQGKVGGRQTVEDECARGRLLGRPRESRERGRSRCSCERPLEPPTEPLGRVV